MPPASLTRVSCERWHWSRCESITKFLYAVAASVAAVLHLAAVALQVAKSEQPCSRSGPSWVAEN
eukprot:189658-Pyramimonas_sp.AAC.1